MILKRKDYESPVIFFGSLTKTNIFMTSDNLGGIPESWLEEGVLDEGGLGL